MCPFDGCRIRHVAEMFSTRREEILQSWMAYFQEAKIARDEIEADLFRQGFQEILCGFEKYLRVGDFESYFACNAKIARKISSNDVSYSGFLEAFHYFEDSYLKILLDGVPKEELVQYLLAMDKLHHRTIAIVSGEYFRINERTIFALAKLAELRDPETGFHLERTREFSVTLAKALGVSEDFTTQLYKVGPLHDIGKIAIEDGILLKPGPLTPEEFERMKQHTVFGREAIAGIIGEQDVARGHLLMALEIALYHHERYDGNGYPEGLAGPDIPLAARIFAVADAYDAIVSKRAYKEALPHAVAVERITAEAGKQFDPRVVEAFLAVQGEFAEIHAKYEEGVFACELNGKAKVKR